MGRKGLSAHQATTSNLEAIRRAMDAFDIALVEVSSEVTSHTAANVEIDSTTEDNDEKIILNIIITIIYILIFLGLFFGLVFSSYKRNHMRLLQEEQSNYPMVQQQQVIIQRWNLDAPP